MKVKLANGDVYDDPGVIDVDERKDLVLLKIKAFGLTAAPFGNSDQISVGDNVIVVGSPSGLDQTVSSGVVSAIRDSGEGYRLFQTSAAASPGSSGGGMFDGLGRLVGIVSSKLTAGENLNFAIPVNYVRGLNSSQIRMTLAELAKKFPGQENTSTQRAQTRSSTDSTAQNRLDSLVKGIDLEFEKLSDASWTTSFRGEKISSVEVNVKVLEELSSHSDRGRQICRSEPGHVEANSGSKFQCRFSKGFE